MAKIKVLEESLIHQIAAGEVVERPVSAVKELVENAIDANATSIVIEIQNGGIDLIKISDNGNGMNREDAQMCTVHHATSKIETENDLHNILTMGFRGEALSSIAAVSQMEIVTKREGDIEGTKIIVEGGEFREALPCGCPVGTQVTIKNLFYNTPARRKFLKNEQTEYQHILDVTVDFALSYPGIQFKLINDGRVVFEVPKTTELKNRLSAVLGKDIVEELIPIFYGGHELKIQGFVSTPRLTRANRKGQHLFVNNRQVEDAFLGHAIRSAYKVYLKPGMYPIFIVKIKIDPRFVDVNVHPRKTEVRFADQGFVYKALLKASMTALDRYILAPKLFLGREEHEENREENHEQVLPPSEGKKEPTVGELMARSLNMGFEQELQKKEELKIIPIAQIGDSYILAEDEGGVVIIDQHAAHERIMYEKLRDALKEKKPASQKLIEPVTFELSLSDMEILKIHNEILHEAGFEIESFGGQTCALYAVPNGIKLEDAREIVLGVLDDLREEGYIHEVQKREEKVLEIVACRGAVKFGQTLTREEQIALIQQLKEVEEKYACPHGRPTMVRLSYDELERKFGRK